MQVLVLTYCYQCGAPYPPRITDTAWVEVVQDGIGHLIREAAEKHRAACPYYAPTSEVAS